MNCPYCDNEMEKGYIDQTKVFAPLEWYPAKQERGVLVDMSKSIRLTSLWKSGAVIVHHCALCRKFVIDEEEVGV